MKSLVLFVHGLGGSAATWSPPQRWSFKRLTAFCARMWCRDREVGSSDSVDVADLPLFLKLIREDEELARRYDVATYNYSTAMFGPAPSLQTCAKSLGTAIELRHARYKSIAIVAHSQGGLIARCYIAERINSGRPLRVDRLLTFATPHHGAAGATALQWLGSRQTRALDLNSEFMQHLALAWEQAKGDQKVATKYVVAENDWVVGPVSASASSPIDAAVVSGVGHIDLVKPESAASDSFLVAKQFLLDESWQPSGVEADYHPPVLRSNRLSLSEATRFVYGARALPFIGRIDELKAIDTFLSDAKTPFRWMVLHGSGGVGKSRLALELCLAVASDWHAGFLADGANEPDWTRWRPMAPTLIVVDYAARDAERAGVMLRALAGRNEYDGDVRRLTAPVRVILIERTASGDWLDHIVDADARTRSTHAPDLALKAVSDPWPFFEHVLSENGRALPNKAKTLAALAEIDPESRPLFAYFMADALADGRDVHAFDAQRLVEDVIQRARAKFWRPAGAGPKEERLLALATMAGGLPISKIAVLPPLFRFEWDIDRHSKIFEVMTGRAANKTIPPLQPDIVGEHFTLAALANATLSDSERRTFLDAAWTINPLGTAQFSVRAHRDIAVGAELGWLREKPEGDAAANRLWAMVSVDLMTLIPTRDSESARGLLIEMRTLADAQNEPTLWLLWAMAATNFMIVSRAHDPQAARSVLDEMRAAASTRFETGLWRQWARAATNLIVDLRSRNPGAARDLLADMRAIAKELNDPTCWESWAAATSNIMIAARDHGAQIASDLLNDLRAVASLREEPRLWDQWGKAATNLMVDLPAWDYQAAQRLLDEMRAVANRRREPTVWKHWAKAATNLMIELPDRDLQAARRLLEEMHAAAQGQSEPAMWESWARAATNITGHPGARDPIMTASLLDEMHAVANRRNETPLWEEWAKAATNFAADLPALDLRAARALVDEMRAIAARIGEAALWEHWAKAATNLMTELPAQDFQAAQTLLDDIYAIAETRNEPALQEQWGAAAFNLVLNLSLGLEVADLSATRSILNQLRTAAERQNDSHLWELWGKAAFNLASKLSGQSYTAALSILAEMRKAARARDEPALWERWAEAATNLIPNLADRDVEAARDLVVEMRRLAEARSEPALWELSLRATGPLAINLSSTNPQAGRSLLAEMWGVAETRQEPDLTEWCIVTTIVLASEVRKHDPNEAAALLKRLETVPREVVERALRRMNPGGSPP